jgi:hypothetical protein
LLLTGLSSLPFTAAMAGDAAQLDLQALTLEAARVLWELHVFERVYLPALLGQPAWPSPALAPWKRAVWHLRRAVPRASRGQSTPHTETLRNACAAAAPGCGDFLGDSPSECFSWVGGTICWHIYPYWGQGAAEREDQVRFVLRWAGVSDDQAAAPWVELRRVLPAVEDIYVGRTPLSDKKLGGYVAPLPTLAEVVLPVLAELDPAFVAQALDRGRLMAAVESSPALTPEERVLQRNLVNSRFFAGWLCYSLVLVLEALANNHFAEIARFLTYPEIHADSFWASLMPKILLATLYRKTVVLRDLARKVPPGRAESGRPGIDFPSEDDRLTFYRH